MRKYLRNKNNEKKKTEEIFNLDVFSFNNLNFKIVIFILLWVLELDKSVLVVLYVLDFRLKRKKFIRKMGKFYGNKSDLILKF